MCCVSSNDIGVCNITNSNWNSNVINEVWILEKNQFNIPTTRHKYEGCVGVFVGSIDSCADCWRCSLLVIVVRNVCNFFFHLLCEFYSEFAVECCTVASIPRWRDCCLHDVEAAEAAGVSASTGRLHQGWAEEPEEGISSCSGGSEAYSERSAGDRSVPWSRRSEQRHRWLNNGYERHADRTTL